MDAGPEQKVAPDRQVDAGWACRVHFLLFRVLVHLLAHLSQFAALDGLLTNI